MLTSGRLKQRSKPSVCWNEKCFCDCVERDSFWDPTCVWKCLKQKSMCSKIKLLKPPFFERRPMYRYILSKLIPSSISFNFDMLSDQFLEFTLIISLFICINLKVSKQNFVGYLSFMCMKDILKYVLECYSIEYCKWNKFSEVFAAIYRKCFIACVTESLPISSKKWSFKKIDCFDRPWLWCAKPRGSQPSWSHIWTIGIMNLTKTQSFPCLFPT